LNRIERLYAVSYVVEDIVVKTSTLPRSVQLTDFIAFQVFICRAATTNQNNERIFMAAATARNQTPGDTIRLEGVTCPFCPLLPDDLNIEQSGDQLRLSGHDCAKSRAALEKPPKKLQPRIKGKAVSLDEAVAAAAGILRKSRHPLLSGLATDVGGMRAAVALAESTGAVLDHMHGQAISNNYRVLQARGWMTTTLTEIRNRADLVLFVGTDAGQFQDFYERAIWPQEAMFEPKPANRRLVYLGSGLQSKLGQKGQRKPQHLKCKPEELGEVVGALNAVANDQPLNQKVAGIKQADLQALAGELQQARYSVIVWSPAELPEANAEPIIESICNLVETLNATTRSSGFILGGQDAAVTAVNVTAWLTGYPLRVSFARGYPEYDPVAYGLDNMLESRSADSILWLSTLNADKKMPAVGNMPSIVIADSDTAYTKQPDVFIPAGTPGIDHAGTLIRADGVVSLPLRKLRDSDRPSGRDVLQAIHAKL